MLIFRVTELTDIATSSVLYDPTPVPTSFPAFIAIPFLMMVTVTGLNGLTMVF